MIQQCLINSLLQVISILGETLEPFDDDGVIPAYGFGDFITKDKDIFPLKDDVSIEMSDKTSLAWP